MITVELAGLLGEAITASRRGRLRTFITGPASPPIVLFDRAVAARNREGDWYGEHAGKWLVAAARSGDAALAGAVRAVANFLCDQQDSDGYLGTYAPERRFMVPQPPKPWSWDGAPSVRTWDLWTHSYLMLGLIEAHRAFGATAEASRWLDAASRIADLCHRTLKQIDVTELGNHHGLSATVLMDPAVELHLATGEQRHLDLAWLVLRQADAHAPLALLQRALAGTDAADIATGKAYQLAWNLVGLAKLHRATGRADLRQACQRLWLNIREQHLSLGGGPFGGVGHRSREVFNAPGFFDPQAYVETCSTLAWLQLNRELLAITGDARHGDEIERTAYNDLLGAAAPDGEDWCYYSFANGRRVHTTPWRCCKSSGAMALEELPSLAYTRPRPGVIAVNLYGPGRARCAETGVTIEQRTRYPFDGEIALHVEPDATRAAACRFTLRLRVPAWADAATVRVNGEAAVSSGPGHVELDRTWLPGDRVMLQLPMPPRLHSRASHNTQVSRAPDGSEVRQDVLHHAYVAITRGPLVFSAPLIDGFKTQETLQPPLTLTDAEPAEDGLPNVMLASARRDAIRFVPYFAAGGRHHGAWRVTWLALAPQDNIP